MVFTGNGELGFDSGEGALPHPRKAAGAQITQSWLREVVTINNDAGLFRVLQLEWVQFKPLNEEPLEGKSGTVPAAAVIPAPVAYIKVVAVKKLVVEFWVC